LPNGYKNDGTEDRGYLLDTTSVESMVSSVEKLDDSIVLEGEIAYRCNPQRQFNDFSDKAHQIFETFALYASTKRAEELGERVELTIGDRTMTLDVVEDDRMDGDIVALPDFKSSEDIYALFGDSRYKTVTMRKV